MGPQTREKTHELVRLTKGDLSLKHIDSGEVMHSNVGPREEARLLYIEQSKLAQRLSEGSTELVLYDIGLGAATNALAAVQCHRKLQKPCPLHIVSFESDLSGLKLAYDHRDQFPYFEGLEDAVAQLLETKHWYSDNIKWSVHEGDFRTTVEHAPPADVVFFDFYSPKANPELWDVSTFKKVLEHTQATATLYTYSASTRVRVALLVAGFYVGYGQSTGTKTDTTVAARELEQLERPLDTRWLERFSRSDQPLPHAWPSENRAELFALIRQHKQFI